MDTHINSQQVLDLLLFYSQRVLIPVFQMKHSTDLPTAEIIEENDATVNAMPHQMYTNAAGDAVITCKDDAVDSISTTRNQKSSRLASWYRFVMGDIYASDDPNLYSERRKNVIILLVALSGIAGPMSSMMYMPGILAVVQDLHTTTSAVNGTISAFVVFMGISVGLFTHALKHWYTDLMISTAVGVGRSE